MAIEIVSGDVLNSSETWLAQQCNCKTVRGKGLSAAIFSKFPHANIYKDRKSPDEPGRTIFRGELGKDRLVANLLAQYYPGKSSKKKTKSGEADDEAQRRTWFMKCLMQIKEKADGFSRLERSVAVPFGIGCGLAGGNWNEYQRILREFSEDHNFTIVIYKL